MTASKHLIAMIRSHAEGDDQRFMAIAEHIADDASRSGKGKVAADIRLALANAALSVRPEPARPIPISAPRGELAGLVKSFYPDTRMSDLVLNPDLERRVARLVREHRERTVLEASGLSPRRKYLFAGPPGTGKGLTASAVAGELGLPLFTILLDGVITKYMGETASKLRLVFEAMHTARGVYFFDEVDALAARRDTDNDVGEARRMLNSFLQFLEDDRSNSIIIAATNHKALLDPAIFRRFHAALDYAKPSGPEARRVIENHLLQFDRGPLDWSTIEGAASGLSQADLVAAADDAAREAVLDHQGAVSTEILVQALKDRTTIHPE